ncbi:hypothetical protein ACTXT7_015586 [Hymenolepis weldensis]
MYQTTPQVVAQIWIRHHKLLRSRYAAVSSQPKMDAMEIYVNAYYFSVVKSRNTGDPTQLSARRFRKPRKRFKVNSKYKFMDQQLLPEVSDKEK